MKGKIATPLQSFARNCGVGVQIVELIAHSGPAKQRSYASGGALYKRAMTKEVFGKHMVWTVDPRTNAEIGIGYSSLTEAQAEAVKLENVGYKILRITPTTLPKPNS